MAGILLPGVKAHIIPKEDSSGEARELFPGRPNVAMGSLNDTTSPSGTFTTDGRMRTGDGFVADEQGRFL